MLRWQHSGGRQKHSRRAGPLSRAMTKRRKSSDSTTGGRSFSRGNLYQLLHNPIYIGEVRHRGKTYPAQHQGIIDRNT